MCCKEWRRQTQEKSDQSKSRDTTNEQSRVSVRMTKKDLGANPTERLGRRDVRAVQDPGGEGTVERQLETFIDSFMIIFHCNVLVWKILE